MGWIKRNLFFVIGVVVALLLLGASGYYIWSESALNAAKLDSLNEIYGRLKDANSHKPSPGNDKVDNIKAAHDQAAQLREWIRQTTNYFQRIPPIPAANNGLTDDAFAGALHRTISQLQHEADAASVTLQPQYNFSFQVQSDKVRFAPPGSVEKLAVQLGEVKTIVEMLFAAHVNALDGVQRLRVSDDDAQGQTSDYIDEQPVTTELATLTPYQVTFRGFSSEIAQVLAAFATSPHGFIIKTINVQPASATPGSENPTPPPAAMPARGGMQTVLTEQMLRVTMMIEVVKLSAAK